MIILWSSGHDVTKVGFIDDNTVCSACGNKSGRAILKDVFYVKLFFFIPIFWWTTWYVTCPVCGKREKTDKKTAMQLAEEGASRTNAAEADLSPFPEMNAAQEDNAAESQLSGSLRKITIKREKRYFAGGVPARILCEGNFITEVWNGKEACFQLDDKDHSIVLNVIDANAQWLSDPIPLPAGNVDITLTIASDRKHGGFKVLSVE